MKASREQHKDQMSKIATLPSVNKKILMFWIHLLLSVIHQTVSTMRIGLQCACERLASPLGCCAA